MVLAPKLSHAVESAFPDIPTVLAELMDNVPLLKPSPTVMSVPVAELVIAPPAAKFKVRPLPMVIPLLNAMALVKPSKVKSYEVAERSKAPRPPTVMAPVPVDRPTVTVPPETIFRSSLVVREKVELALIPTVVASVDGKRNTLAPARAP